MAGLILDNGHILEGLVISPTAGSGLTNALYPSGTWVYNASDSIFKSVSTNYPAWETVNFTSGYHTLLTLKNEVELEVYFPTSNVGAGGYARYQTYLKNKSGNRKLIQTTTYGGTFTYLSILYDKPLDNGAIAGLAIAYSYASSFNTGERLLQIDELINSLPGTNVNPNSMIASDLKDNHYTYIWHCTDFSNTYYTSDNVDFTQTIKDNDNPYNPTGDNTSKPDGGNGTFDNTSVAIGWPDIPDLSATDSGFFTLYNPSLSQVKSLASYMWSTDFDLDTFKKLFQNPMDAILGLSIVPVKPSTGDSKSIKLGNITSSVSAPVITSQYVDLDCGSLAIEKYWGAYLDYNPYTKCFLYLPYIGLQELNIDDIQDKTIQVLYRFDVVSGACVAMIKCGESVLYTYSGNGSEQIPITGTDFTSIIRAATTIGGILVSTGSAIATGGLSAGLTAGLASTAANVASMKTSVNRSGSLSGNHGLLGIQTPYLIIVRPNQVNPAQQNSFTGYPSYITEYLSSLSGYTEVEKVHLNNLPATEAEVDEINELLSNGVIF